MSLIVRFSCFSVLRLYALEMKKLILLFIFFSFSSFAQIIDNAWVQAEHKDVRLTLEDKTEYPMIHLNRPEGTPVILLHGIGGNAHNWMDLAPALYKSGFDVWAFTWAANRDRNIDEAGSLTVKEIVNYVYLKTGKKSFLVGHSLGGIISKIYVLGVVKSPRTGKYYVSKVAKRNSKARLHGFVSVASPNGVNPESLVKFLPFFANLPTVNLIGTKDLSKVINAGNLERDLWYARAIEVNTLGSRLPIISTAMKLLFNMKYHRISDYDLGRISRYGFGAVPPAVIDQVRSVGNEGLVSSDTQTDYAKIFVEEKRHLPFAFISAGADQIAPDDSISFEADAQNSEFLSLPSAGHLDPLMGEMMDETLYFMNRFFNETLDRQ